MNNINIDRIGNDLADAYEEGYKQGIKENEENNKKLRNLHKAIIQASEEEKKYKYRLKEKYWWIIEDLDIYKTYLNWMIDEQGARPLTLNDSEDLPLDKTIFTDKEIQEVAKKHGVDLEMFDKIEVE